MEWFKWFIFAYFIIRVAVMVGKSLNHQGKDAFTDIGAASLLGLTAVGIYFWL